MQKSSIGDGAGSQQQQQQQQPYQGIAEQPPSLKDLREFSRRMNKGVDGKPQSTLGTYYPPMINSDSYTNSPNISSSQTQQQQQQQQQRIGQDSSTAKLGIKQSNPTDKEKKGIQLSSMQKGISSRIKKLNKSITAGKGGNGSVISESIQDDDMNSHVMGSVNTQQQRQNTIADATGSGSKPNSFSNDHNSGGARRFTVRDTVLKKMKLRGGSHQQPVADEDTDVDEEEEDREEAENASKSSGDEAEYNNNNNNGYHDEGEINATKKNKKHSGDGIKQSGKRIPSVPLSSSGATNGTSNNNNNNNILGNKSNTKMTGKLNGNNSLVISPSNTKKSSGLQGEFSPTSVSGGIRGSAGAIENFSIGSSNSSKARAIIQNALVQEDENVGISPLVSRSTGGVASDDHDRATDIQQWKEYSRTLNRRIRSAAKLEAQIESSTKAAIEKQVEERIKSENLAVLDEIKVTNAAADAKFFELQNRVTDLLQQLNTKFVQVSIRVAEFEDNVQKLTSDTGDKFLQFKDEQESNEAHWETELRGKIQRIIQARERNYATIVAHIENRLGEAGKTNEGHLNQTGILDTIVTNFSELALLGLGTIIFAVTRVFGNCIRGVKRCMCMYRSNHNIQKQKMKE